MTQGGYQLIIISPIKSKMATAKKQCFLQFLYWTESSPPSFKVRGLQMTINLSLVQIHISSKHSNLSFAHHLVIYLLVKNGVNKNQNQDSYQRETIPDKFIFFFNIGKAKNVNRVSKIRVCMYVSEMCAEGIFVTFPWWLKNVKSRSKIALFSNEHHFEMWFLKKKTTTFFWSKLSKLHKKRPNFACDNYIFPKTRWNKINQCTHSTPLKQKIQLYEALLQNKAGLGRVS